MSIQIRGPTCCPLDFVPLFWCLTKTNYSDQLITDYCMIVGLHINKRHVTHRGPQLEAPVAVLFNLVLSLRRLLRDAGLHYSKADGCLCQGGPKCLKFWTPRPSFTSVQDLTNNLQRESRLGQECPLKSCYMNHRASQNHWTINHHYPLKPLHASHV